MISKNLKFATLIVVGAGLILPIWQGCSAGGFSVHEATSTASFSSNFIADKTCAESAVTEAPIQRLTKVEYNNVIRDLFGLNKDYSVDFSKNAEGPAGFTTEGEAQNLSLAVVIDYWKASKVVTDDLFAMTPNTFLTCNAGEACAKDLITKLARKAYRRPATAEEIEKLLVLYRNASGATFSEKLKVAVRTVLVSPQFIYRVYELPPNGLPTVELNGYELASRLSFLVWGSIPDEALLVDAGAGRLRDRTVFLSHVKRMLADSRVSYLSKSFGHDWLKLSKLDEVNLDPARFPTWNANLRNSMMNETTTFMNNVFTSDLSVMELVSGQYSFLDQRMSQHYGVPGATSTQFVKVNLDSKRAGILTHPSILTLTSTAIRTSPVVRGKWFLEQILCSGTGAPPAEIPLPADGPASSFSESQIRERLVAHMNQGPGCFNCHRQLDPIGLAYENYDASGAFRTRYIDGVAVDASGKLPSGEPLRDFADLAKVVQSDPRFRACFAEKLASFANGKNLNSSAAKCASRSIASKSVGPDKKFSDLVMSVVEHETFRLRKVKY